MELSEKIEAIGRKLLSGGISSLQQALASRSKPKVDYDDSTTVLVSEALQSGKSMEQGDQGVNHHGKHSRSGSISSIRRGKPKSSVLPELMIGVWYNSGTLWVNLNRARNLGISNGKLYVKTYLLPDLGNSKQKTGFIEGTQDPEFNATMAYIVEESDLPSRVLCVSAWNRTSFMGNQFIGQVTLPLVSLNLSDPSHNWYTLLTTKHASGKDYKHVEKLPPVLKIGLMFVPDLNCHDMEGSGTLKLSVTEARNLSSLTHVTNLNRVWVCSSLFPDWHITRERTPKCGHGDSPTWEHTFTYDNKQLRSLLEDVALDISVEGYNGVVGRVRLCGYPGRSNKYQPWMDSTEREAAHWEEVLGRPGKWVERWHQIDESLIDRDVDLSKKPPIFIEPFSKPRNSCKGKYLKYSDSNNNIRITYISNHIPLDKDANVDNKQKYIAGKLLGRVYYDNEDLTLHLNRVSGLHGGINREKLYNPYIKIYLVPDEDKCTKRKTICQWKTRNPVFNVSYKYQAQLAESKYHTLRITVWHRSRLGNAKLVAETNIPLSSVNHSDRMDHWFSLFQPCHGKRVSTF